MYSGTSSGALSEICAYANIQLLLLCSTARNMANIDRTSFIAELSRVLDFSSVEKANQYCDFCALY